MSPLSCSGGAGYWGGSYGNSILVHFYTILRSNGCGYVEG